MLIKPLFLEKRRFLNVFMKLIPAIRYLLDDIQKLKQRLTLILITYIYLCNKLIIILIN